MSMVGHQTHDTIGNVTHFTIPEQRGEHSGNQILAELIALGIGDVVVPLWVSWIGLAIAGYLAYQGVKVSRANEVAALRRKQTIGSVNKVLVFLVRVSASARTGFDQVTLWPQNTQGFNSWPEELLQRNASLMLKHAPFASSMRYVNPSP